MIQRLRRLSGVAARPLAEDLARKIAHELRASSAALASVDQLGVGHLGTVQLAKYTLARALIQSQRAGCSLYPPRPAAQTPNGLSPADERLIRAVAALEEMSARRAPKAGASSASAPDAGAGKASPALLTAANKADRTFLMSFLADVLHSSAEPMDAAQLLARWRYAPPHRSSLRGACQRGLRALAGRTRSGCGGLGVRRARTAHTPPHQRRACAAPRPPPQARERQRALQLDGGGG